MRTALAWWLAWLMGFQPSPADEPAQIVGPSRLVVNIETKVEPKFPFGSYAKIEVSIRDVEGRPVEGAEVTFQVESKGGAGARFCHYVKEPEMVVCDKETERVKSDKDGRAIRGWVVPVGNYGAYMIMVQAWHPSLGEGKAALEPTNEAGPQQLQLIGSGAMYYPCKGPEGRRKYADPPAVQVVDERGSGVAGAEVEMTIGNGQSGSFTGGRQSVKLWTTPEGHAVAWGWFPGQADKFAIEVKARLGPHVFGKTVIQGERRKVGCFPTTAVALGILAAAGGSGAILGLRRAAGGASPGAAAPPRSVTITPGPPVFGPPK